MAETTLLALALSVQDAHSRLVPAADEMPAEARFLIAEIQRRLEILVTAIRAREGELDGLHEALADRMNNLLMAIQTTRDLMRNGDAEDTSRVRDQLDSVVDTGRQSLKRLRDALAHLR